MTPHFLTRHGIECVEAEVATTHEHQATAGHNRTGGTRRTQTRRQRNPLQRGVIAQKRHIANDRPPRDLTAMQIDLLSLTGHKYYGPKGAGALYVLRRGATGDFTQVHRFGTERLGMGTQLGQAVAASGGIAVAGAPLASFFEGLAHIYERDRATGEWRDAGAVIDTLGDALPAVTGGGFACSPYRSDGSPAFRTK